jgi:hypothetical protein
VDISTISTLLTSLKTATDIARFIKDGDLSLEKAETKLKLAELISALADAKIEVTEVQQMLQDKDAELRELQEKLETKEQLRWEEPYYWRLLGATKDGPYCQHCYDTDRRLIRLQGNGEGYWECKACKNSFLDSQYRASSHVHISRRDYDPYDL